LSAIDGLRRNVADALRLFVVPALLATLGWRVAFRLMRFWSRVAPGSHREADPSWDVAKAYLDGADASQWKADLRLAIWVERVDTYLTLLRSARWWQRQVDVDGTFPPAGAPYLLLTYHWGTGGWIWSLLDAHGIGASFLLRRPVALDFGTSRVAWWYVRLRSWALPRIGSRGPIYTGDSSAQLLDGWTRGESVLGMLDVPVGEARKALPVELLGRRARLPYGLLQLAASAGVRVVLLSCGLDVASGRRALHVEMLPEGLDVDGMLARYAGHLDARLREAPAAWHLWRDASAIFVEPAAQ
jgi:hypothetical protein